MLALEAFYLFTKPDIDDTVKANARRLTLQIASLDNLQTQKSIKLLGFTLNCKFDF